MIRPIVKYPDPILRKVSSPVLHFDDELRQLARDMVETMYAAPGIGLAAPQIGVNRRLIVVDLSVGSQTGELYVAVNPEVLEVSGEQYGEEGCLCIPDVTEAVTRPNFLRMRAHDPDGNLYEIEAKELLARCLLHEIDHLDGVLFIDRLPPVKRGLIKRRLRKALAVAEPAV